MKRKIEYPFFYDDMPIDISFCFRRDRPAGTHGFVTVSGDHFAFEDGTPARFWGVCFNGGMSFLEHDDAEKIARRLEMTGVNMVRFHQFDAPENTPNIFQYRKGERLADSRHMDPESLDRLDYLVAQLKKRGIYCYLDMNATRIFFEGDGVESARQLYETADPYCYYNRRLIELQKEFSLNLWNHVNPYTGLAYKDDPVFAMCELLNERDFFSRRMLRVEPYVTEYRTLLDQWVKARGVAYDAWTCDVNAMEQPQIDFKVELMAAFFAEMRGALREAGVRVPIAGTNWGNAATIKASLDNDYIDAHMYYANLNWGAEDKRFFEAGLDECEDVGGRNVIANRLLDRPLIITEWDVSWPNAYRAIGPLLYAAIGALQGFGGMLVHAYAYGPWHKRQRVLGKEFSAYGIGGGTYREGVFTTWNDPAIYGLFYHAALMTRRGDVRESDKTIGVQVRALTQKTTPAMALLPERCKAGIQFDGQPGTADERVEPDKRVVDGSDGEVRSVTGEMYRSWKKHIGWIDTPRTKVLYGRLEENGAAELAGLSIASKADFAVIALSSLSDAAIEDADNLLLTTVGRAANKNAAFEGGRMIELGEEPVLLDAIDAEISIRTRHANLQVYAVGAEGMNAGYVPSEYADGVLRFRVGPLWPSLYYLIQTR